MATWSSNNFEVDLMEKPVFGDDQRLSFATAARSKSCNSLYVCSISIFHLLHYSEEAKNWGKSSLMSVIFHVIFLVNHHFLLNAAHPRATITSGGVASHEVLGVGGFSSSHIISSYFWRALITTKTSTWLPSCLLELHRNMDKIPPPHDKERAECPSRARRDVDEGIVSLLLLVGSNSLLPLIRVISIKTCCLLYMRSPFVQLLHYFRLSHNLTTLQGVKHILFTSATNLLLKWCKKALTLYAPRPLFKTLEGGYFIKAIISSQNSIRSLGIN